MVNDNGDYMKAEPNGHALPTTGGDYAAAESLFEMAWRSRWLILVAVVLSLAGGVFYLSRATPLYTSESRIYVEQSGPKIISPLEEGVMTQSKNYLFTQAELMTSTPVLSLALAQPGIKGMRTFGAVSNHIGYLKKVIGVEVGRKDDILNVSLETPYPIESAAIVNAVVDAYVTFHAQTKRTTASEVLRILQKEKENRSQQLSDSLKALMDYKTQNEALALETDKGNILLNELQNLAETLRQAQQATVRARSVCECAQAMAGTPEQLAQFLRLQQTGAAFISSSDGKRAELESQLDQLRRRHADRLRTLGPDHPGLEAVQIEIARVQEQLEQLDAKTVQVQLAAAEGHYMVCKSEEEQVAAHYEELRKQVLDLNKQFATYTILQSEYDQIRKLCDVIDDRIKELNVSEDAGALNITILETASVESDPSSPKKARTLAMSLMLGLVLAGGLSFGRSWLDQRFRSTDEISAVLGLPMLGIVPAMSKRDSVSVRARKTYQESASPAAEAYRTIRTAVFFGVSKDRGKTLLVTSPMAGDGKTTLITNLAISMAQAGQRVLLIDADFRKPMQHAVFEISKEPGLSNLIAGFGTVGSCVRQTLVESLWILPCGSDVPNPSELLNSDAFARLLDELTDQYDRVLIDAPPVIPVADACILGAVANVTLLVLRADKSKRRSSMEALSRLQSLGASVLGVVVNDVHQRRSHYGYGYGYGYENLRDAKGSGDKADKQSVGRPGAVSASKAASFSSQST